MNELIVLILVCLFAPVVAIFVLVVGMIVVAEILEKVSR